MKLDERTMRLIAVGASLAANCQPCLQINVTAALGAGIDEHEIREAVDVGKRVRRGAASKMDRFAASLDRSAAFPEGLSSEGCECNPSSAVD
jgi:AhpD family alkylhydroperoxidase